MLQLFGQLFSFYCVEMLTQNQQVKNEMSPVLTNFRKLRQPRLFLPGFRTVGLCCVASPVLRPQKGSILGQTIKRHFWLESPKKYPLIVKSSVEERGVPHVVPGLTWNHTTRQVSDVTRHLTGHRIQLGQKQKHDSLRGSELYPLTPSPTWPISMNV